MQYISTRGGEERVSSAQAIKQGIAADGGLFVPETLPEFTGQELRSMMDMTYPQRAAAILGKFLCDYTEQELTAYCEKAYSDKRFTSAKSPAPVVQLNDQISVLELYHGPDIRLQRHGASAHAVASRRSA